MIYCCKTSVLVGWIFTSYTIDEWLVVRFYHCWFIGSCQCFEINDCCYLRNWDVACFKKKCMWVDLRFIIFKDSRNCFKVRFFVEKKNLQNFSLRTYGKILPTKKVKYLKLVCTLIRHTIVKLVTLWTCIAFCNIRKHVLH